MSKTTLQKGREYFIVIPANPNDKNLQSAVDLLAERLQINYCGWMAMSNANKIQFIESNGTNDEGTSPRAIKERRKRGTQRIPVKYIKAVDLGIDIIE